MHRARTTIYRQPAPAMHDAPRRASRHNRPYRCLVAVLALATCGFAAASTAVEKVQQGIRHFTAGEFDAADRSFNEADVARPEDPTIAFNRACALAATGDVEKARELFRQAALARETALAARSHYNLGCLSSEQGRAVLGEDPAAAAPEQRQQGLSLLLSAVGHYRDCLRLDPGHADARHNLELIRLFVKHVQSQWEQQDREQTREEMELLEFLAMIEQRQSALRATTRSLTGQPDSPHRRQTAQETTESQTQLYEEIQPLREKLAEQFQAAQQAPTSAAAPPVRDEQQPDQAQEAQRLLTQLADEAGKYMITATSELADKDFRAAAARQRDVLDRLNQIFMAIGPFTGVLQRAAGQQETLTIASEAWSDPEESTAAANPPAESDTAAAPIDSHIKDESLGNRFQQSDSDHAADFPELAWQQSRVTDWSHMLTLKAQAELQALESQQHSQLPPATAPGSQSTKPDNRDTNDDAADRKTSSPATDDQAAQLEALKQSLQKATELAPEAQRHSELAAGHLGSDDLPTALPEQRETLRLLREIAEPLSQNQQQEGDHNNENQQNGQQDQQQPSTNRAEDQVPAGESPQERALSVLRRARERERQHRDLEKQLQQMIGSPIRVERDW